MMFNERIQQLREAHQISQRKLMEALDFDTTVYCKIENGELRIKAGQVVAIASLLETDKYKFLLFDLLVKLQKRLNTNIKLQAKRLILRKRKLIK